MRPVICLLLLPASISNLCCYKAPLLGRIVLLHLFLIEAGKRPGLVFMAGYHHIFLCTCMPYIIPLTGDNSNGYSAGLVITGNGRRLCCGLTIITMISYLLTQGNSCCNDKEEEDGYLFHFEILGEDVPGSENGGLL